MEGSRGKEGGGGGIEGIPCGRTLSLRLDIISVARWGHCC